MAEFLDTKSLLWAKIFGMAGVVMPFVMMAVNWLVSMFIDKTNVSGVNVTFAVAQVNVRNAIASGGYQGQISDWLAGLFGYQIPALLANVPGATVNVFGIPLVSLLAGGIAGAIAGLVASKVISGLGISTGKGYMMYLAYALVASVIGYVIVLFGTALPNFIGGTEIAIAMLINAAALAVVAQFLAEKVKV